MDPSEVRATILDQHAALRESLAKLRVIASTAARGEADDIRALRELGMRVLSALEGHLRFEDVHLIPALREADAWGKERAALVAREHAEQRELFRYILERLREASRPSMLLGREIENLVASLLTDMSEEEETMLHENLLRDDVVGVDVEAG